MYMVDKEPAPSAAQFTDLLRTAGVYQLVIAQWLRQQGAEWPTQLRSHGRPWGAAALQWARDEGCTSPTADSVGLTIANCKRLMRTLLQFVQREHLESQQFTATIDGLNIISTCEARVSPVAYLSTTLTAGTCSRCSHV
eukprot:9272-Heterococcus_DN1.PRE.3